MDDESWFLLAKLTLISNVPFTITIGVVEKKELSFVLVVDNTFPFELLFKVNSVVIPGTKCV